MTGPNRISLDFTISSHRELPIPLLHLPPLAFSPVSFPPFTPSPLDLPPLPPCFPACHPPPCPPRFSLMPPLVFRTHPPVYLGPLTPPFPSRHTPPTVTLTSPLFYAKRGTCSRLPLYSTTPSHRPRISLSSRPLYQHIVHPLALFYPVPLRFTRLDGYYRPPPISPPPPFRSYPRTSTRHVLCACRHLLPSV